jgi:hypothetical protein
VAEARAAEAALHTKTIDPELDLTSRPASIQTTTSHGKVVLEIEQPDADIARDLLAFAVLDLQSGLLRLEALARQKNAPEALLSFFNEISATIATAHTDQSKLFESGRNLKTLQGYGSTVTEEWDGFAAAQYHALVLQFDEVVKKFPDWRKFVNQPPRAISGTTVEDVATAVEEVADAISRQTDIVAATIGVRLKVLAFNLKNATRWAAEHTALGAPGNIATELLMSDAAQSVANTLMSLVKLGLENVAPMITQFGGNVSEGVGQGVVYIVAAVTTALALLAIPKLAKIFPGVFDNMNEGAKILRELWNDK